METVALEKNLKALQTLYPQVEAEPRLVNIERIGGLPAWIRGAIEVYELPFLGAPSAPIFLILPIAELEFEQLVRVYKQIAEKFHAHALVVADRLPPKHRPLLVKFRIPFIYKDESIFAPDLGLKFSNLKALQIEPKLELENKKDGLAPLAVKVAVGILLKQVPEKFSLQLLHKTLQEKGFNFSLAKLSPVLKDLAASGLLLVHGGGPKKTYEAKDSQNLWAKILALKLSPLFREVEVNYIPKDRLSYTIAGESALAHYSNLAAPKSATIAMTARQFRIVFEKTKDTIAYGDFGNPSTVQIWKADPHIFAIDGVINPIELFFSMREHADERVQIELDGLLANHGLSRK